MEDYRKARGSDTWHWCKDCPEWPTSNFDSSGTRPTTGELCNQCREKDRDRTSTR